MQQAAKPLSRQAAQEADDDFYRHHPELMQNDKRVPVDATDPKQAKLRSDWLKSYEKHGGKVEKVSGKEAAKKVRKANHKAKKKSKVTGVSGGSTACSAKGVPHTSQHTVVSAPKPAAHASPNCDLVALDVQCEHGRKPGRAGILMVVPSSTASLGDKIAGTLKMKGGCGSHPGWSVGGTWTSEGKGSSFHFLAKTWAPAAAGLFGLEGISPHVYRVRANACGGGPLVYEVQAYPPGQVSFKIDVRKMMDGVYYALKHLPIPEERLKEWDKKWLQGAVEYSGAWQEDEGSWKVFYEKSWTGGFDPFFCLGYKGPIYPMTLVPGWLSKWVKAGLFFEIKFSAKVKCGVKGKYWPHNGEDSWHEKNISGGGSGGGGLSLELKLASSEVVEGEIVGETGISADVIASKEATAEAKLSIDFDGVKGNITLKALWGVVEFKREFQLIQKREIYKHDWHLGKED